MDIIIKSMDEKYFFETAKMVTELINYHRKLNNAPKEFWQTDNESIKYLKDCIKNGEVYNICLNDKLIGFFYVRYGGHKMVWLEDIYINEGYRGQGIGKYAIQKLDEIMESKGIISIFLDVSLRNIEAIKFYKECGFDHINVIQLRKNYDKNLDKDDEIDINGFKFKKY